MEKVAFIQNVEVDHEQNIQSKNTDTHIQNYSDDFCRSHAGIVVLEQYPAHYLWAPSNPL